MKVTVKSKLEELGTISEAEFEKRMRGIKFSSIVGIALGCACVLYVISWIALGFDALGFINGSHSSYILILLLGANFYVLGRSSLSRIAEYRFIRQSLMDLHNQRINADQ